MKVGQQAAAERGKLLRIERLIGITPPDLPFARRLADNELVPGGSTRVLARPDNKWAQVREAPLTTPRGLLVQQSRRQIPLRSGRLIPHWVGAASGATMSCGVGPAPDLSYESRSLAFCLRGASQGDRDLYVMINAYWEPLAFAIQDGCAERRARVIDTSRDAPDDFREPGCEVPVGSLTCVVAPQSVVVLLER